MTDERSDEDIAAAVQRGDREAFGTLVERYEQKLLRYARKFLPDAEDRKDLVQDVCIKAYVNIRSFDATRKFSPWIYRIAHNEFINAGKKRWTSKIFSFDLDILFPHPAAPDTADSEANRRALRQLLDRSLADLDAKYREPLVLYYFEDMNYQQIAEIMQIPVSTVGVRLRRGREFLRTIVDRHGG